MNRTLENSIMSKQLFALTISPPKRHNTAYSLYHEDIYTIRRLLNNVSKHYIIIPEFVESTSRLHYHAIVEFHDMIKWHKRNRRLLENQLGFLDLKRLKTFGDHLRWLFYCKKNWPIAQSVLELTTPLIYYSKKTPRAVPYNGKNNQKNLLDYGVIIMA